MDFLHDLHFWLTADDHTKAYALELLAALPMARAGGARLNEIAAASLFTTQSVDAISRQIRAQLGAGTASFTLGAAGEIVQAPVAAIVTAERIVRTVEFGILATRFLSIFSRR